MSETVAEKRLVYRAWQDIEYYCEVEVHDYHLEVKVYEMFVFRDVGEAGWDGSETVTPGKCPRGYAFNRADYCSSPDTVYTTDEAQVFLSGSIKWDGCSNLRFDEQDHVMLHFCSRDEAVAVGTLLGRLYDMAKELIPNWMD